MDLDRFKARLKTPSSLAQAIASATPWLNAGEIYCEIGILQSETLLSALNAHPTALAYAVETSAGTETDTRLAQIADVLEQHRLDDRIFLLQHDFEEFFDDWTQLEPEERIGVYCYSGPSDYRCALTQLLRVKTFLSSRAVLLIANPHISTLRQGVWDFIATHPESALLQEIPHVAWVLAWDAHNPHPPDTEAYFQNCQTEIIDAIRQLRSNDTLYPDAVKQHQAGNWEQAQRLYRQVLQEEPQRFEAWLNLGMLYVALENPSEALKAFQAAVRIDDRQGTAYYGLGLAWEHLKHRPRAIAAYQKALDRDPTLLDAYNNLGNLWYRSGQFDRAESVYRQAVSLNPELVGSSLNLGNALIAQGRLDEAISIYENALVQHPEDSHLKDNLDRVRQSLDNPNRTLFLDLARSFLQQKDYAAAIPLYRRSIEDGKPIDYLALALCCQETQQFEQSIETLREGIAHFPKETSLQLKLISRLRDLGGIEAALEAAESARKQIPDGLELLTLDRLLLPVFYHSDAEIRQFRQRFQQGLSDIIEQTRLDTPEQRRKALDAISQTSIFYLAYQGFDDLDLLQQYGDWICHVVRSNFPDLDTSEPPPRREKLRIGYVGVSMGDTRLGELYLGWLRHVDREDFEIYTYYLGQQFTDLTEAFQRCSNVFYRLPPSLEEAAPAILRDRLDISIFPDIGPSSLVTQLAALRLAPVQCTTWAHPITSGLPTIDYFLSSDLMEPDNGQEHYRERLVRLPKIGMSVSKPQPPQEIQSDRSTFGLGVDRTVYLSCQSLSKYLPQYDWVFPQIAQQVPNAQFAFIAHPNPGITEQFRQRLDDAFSEVGLDAETFCVILPRLNERNYLELNLVADIFLDTFSWSGGITTLKAIACGLPVVTYPGSMMRSRHSFAILKTLEVTETIASDVEEYIEIAVKLGLDSAWRQKVVEQAKQNEEQLFDDTECVRALEAFFQSIV
ncbi:MAG: tetratricopeptide repeat protein [Cyanobacteria bacterium SID2]|nr:tetratricopeptide repeat protein [Cyanobacteria bacterium SID2]